MKNATITQQMPVKSTEVFETLHCYERRLEWDTLLKEATLTQGHKEAKKGATSLCVGKPFCGFFGLETRYLTFNRPDIASVKLINKPRLFKTFAASIRHEDNEQGSIATYKFQFSVKPRFLAPLIEPFVLFALKIETKKRLQALANYYR